MNTLTNINCFDTIAPPINSGFEQLKKILTNLIIKAKAIIVANKIKTIKIQIKNFKAISNKNFQFMVKHEGFEPKMKKCYCDQSLIDILKEFGGLSSNQPLDIEKLEQSLKD